MRIAANEGEMSRSASVLVCVIVGGVAAAPAPIAVSQTRKEVRVTTHHVDGGLGELTSLDALVGISDSVVVGRVVAARPSNIAPGGLPDEAGDFFSTAYSLKTEQVLRWSKHLDMQPASMDIEVMSVGEVDRGAYIQRHVSEKYRELAPGRTYLLFIKQYALGRSAEARVVWVPATGDGQSIVEIRGANVAPQATTRLALAMAALTPTALFDKIKQIQGGGGEGPLGSFEGTSDEVPFRKYPARSGF